MFSHLTKNLQVSKDSLSTYVFYGIEGEPSVIGRPANEANRPYLDAVLRTGKRLVQKMKAGKLSVSSLQEAREQDLVLYPKYVLTGFAKAPIRQDGQPATGEDLSAFLREIPPDMFDEMRAHYADLSNFRGEDELDDDDVEDLAGNS